LLLKKRDIEQDAPSKDGWGPNLNSGFHFAASTVERSQK
jgi:hypothetical protein